MPDPVEIKIQGDSTGFSSEVDKTVKKINDIDKATDKANRNQQKLARVKGELARHARKEREETFRRLPLEEKIERLERRRLKLKQAIERSTGNELRQTRLILQQQRVGGQLGGLRSSGGGAAAGGAVGGLAAARSIPGVGGLIAAAGSIFGVTQVVNAARGSISKFSNISNRAGRIGVSTERYQELGIAAHNTGASATDVEKSFRSLIQGKNRALKGSKEDVGAFKSFGISTEDLRTMNIDQIFTQIARSIHRSGADSDKLAGLFKVMGKSSQNLLPAFKSGLDGITKSIRESGQVLDSKLNAQLTVAASKMDALSNKWDVFKGRVFATPVSNAIDMFDSLIGGKGFKASIQEISNLSRNPMALWARLFKPDLPGSPMGGMPTRSSMIMGGVTGGGSQNSPDGEFPGIAGPNALARQGLFVGTSPQTQMLQRVLEISRQKLAEHKETNRTIKTLTD